MTVLASRYLRRHEDGHVLETPQEMFLRVARHVAGAESTFEGARATDAWAERFLDAMANLEFLPNSPTLMNAGTPLNQLSACFVLPVEDSMERIFDSLRLMALIQQSGGGAGFSFSRLRPAGDYVASTGGEASGPVSFMRIFDCATDNIRQGGRRRGANMGVLRVDHPDIEQFVDSKRDGESFQNFNLSVGITDTFMHAVETNGGLGLRNPRTGEVIRQIDAAGLFEHIGRAAWETGDPGLIFLDTINRANPTPALGEIEATTPCGEVPLLPYEACTLGSINLSRMTRPAGDRIEIDWSRLERTVVTGVRFLDDVLEVASLPSPRIGAVVRANRKIGLGVMGLAELLIMLDVPYASPAATALVGELMRFVAGTARETSEALARDRGVFANWERSVHAASGRRVRHATLLSIAPTGTLSIIAGTSPSIEPLFALAYRREHVLDDQSLPEVNPVFLRHASERGLPIDTLLPHVLEHGSLVGCSAVDAPTRELFRTALQVEPEAHVRMQAAFQEHVDNAVSKTVNLPESASAGDVARIYSMAWRCGVKGITVYRYGSKGRQVLNLGLDEPPETHEHFTRCDPNACRS
jgi:ribonucleoside-diphosphate reductase alpha chain